MVSLVLRPSGIKKEPWSLQLRYYEAQGINPTYHTILRCGEELAREIVEAGRPYWLFGDPDELRADMEEEANQLDMERDDEHST